MHHPHEAHKCVEARAARVKWSLEADLSTKCPIEVAFRLAGTRILAVGEA
jgi:hypothetical protein